MRARGIVAMLAIVTLLSGGLADASVTIQTVVAFNPGEFPEGVATDVEGNVYVSLIEPVGEIRKIGPAGEQSVLAQFPVPGFGPLGLAVDAAGDLYVAVASFEAATRGVYRVLPDGTTERLPGTEQILFPNGVAVDQRGNVLATDSISGAVWRIQPGGSAEVWVQDVLLEGNGVLQFGFPIGANGLALTRKAIIVSNTENARIVRIPVMPDGSAGTPSVLAEGPELFGADGIAVSVLGNTYVAVNPQSTFVRVASDGSITTLATAADGLNNPASLAFGTSMGNRKALFMTNFAIFSSSPTPALLKVAVGEPGVPLT